MKKLLLILLLIASREAFAESLQLSKFSAKKLSELIADNFEVGYHLTVLNVLASDQAHLSKPIPDGSLTAVKRNGKLEGFVYASRAQGRTETFDYAIVFNPDLSTRLVKILEYRPPYGGAVSGRYWLKQFANKPIDFLFQFGKNVDSISGATISAGGITSDINMVKTNMQQLRTRGLL